MPAFDPRRVLRAVSNDLLRRYFSGKLTLPDVEWDQLGEYDIEPVYAGLLSLSEEGRAEVMATLRRVADLSSPHGAAVMVELIQEHAPLHLEEFGRLEAGADRALWFQLRFGERFEVAAQLTRASWLSKSRYWVRRGGWPQVQLKVTAAMKDRLSAALVAHYRTTQVRGEFCHVDHYRRSNGADFFFALMSDYPDRRPVFRGGKLSAQSDLNTFDHVFVYQQADRTLEVYALGGKKAQLPIQQAFGSAVLGVSQVPGEHLSPPYQLNGLLDPYQPLPTRPEDRVYEVRVRRLRLVPHARAKRRVILEADPDAPDKDIHDMVREYLSHNHLARDRVNVTMASITVSHLTEGNKQRRFSFEITYPHTCSLKSLDDDQRSIGERCLKLWGIDVA